MKSRKMRSIAAAVLALLMLSASLVGCTPGGETEATTAAPDNTEDTPTEAPTDPVPTSAPTEVTTEPDTPAEPVKKIAVIAGGGASNNIYSTIVSLAGKKNPRVILLCTAGKDTVENISGYTTTFRRFTKDIEAIALCTTLYDPQELHDKIVNADIICVGGGQSEFMLDVWEKFKVDEYLKEAYNKGVICCGGSAGGMCWTYAGWNDFYSLPDSIYKFFYGLDLIPIYYGPHFSNSELWAQFDMAIRREKTPKYNIGYAMENGSALVFIDGVATQAVREKGTEHIYTYTFANGVWSRVEYSY